MNTRDYPVKRVHFRFRFRDDRFSDTIVKRGLLGKRQNWPRAIFYGPLLLVNGLRRFLCGKIQKIIKPRFTELRYVILFRRKFARLSRLSRFYKCYKFIDYSVRIRRVFQSAECSGLNSVLRLLIGRKKNIYTYNRVARFKNKIR